MIRTRGLSEAETPRFERFTDHYRGLFKDARLYQGFQNTLLGILAGGSCRVARIAGAGGWSGKGERRIRRLVRGENSRAHLDGEAIGELLTSQGAARLSGEHEVLILLDESDLRKPHARTLEHLDTVRDLQGKPVHGFHTLNAIGIGESGTRALLYHTSFSAQAPGFKSSFDETKKAVAAITRALREQGVGRLLWVLDRGFDNLRLMRYLEGLGECFVVRVQHHDRKLLGGGTLASRLAEAPPVGHLALERRLLEPQAERSGRVQVALRVVRVQEASNGLPLVAVQLSGARGPGWVLLGNLPWGDSEDDKRRLAQRMVQLYRQRWAIEECFAWTKSVLGWEEAQLLSYQGLRTLVAFAWVAAAYLFELGGAQEDERVQLLARLGGWSGRGRAGQRTLAWGLQKLAGYLLIESLDPRSKQQIPALSHDLLGSE